MNRIKELISLVQPHYQPEDPAHDWPHIERVIANAQKLAEGEPVDLPCLLAAVYCHDLVNLPKNHPQRSEASAMAAQKAAPLLIQAGFAPDEVDRIGQIIIEHSFSRGLAPSTLEAAILQDADRLDTLGAIGVLRCASVNTQMKTSFYHHHDPLADTRVLDDKKYMLDHYFIKIFKLPELMNTEKGRKEADKRAHFMRSFINSLMSEIKV